MRTIKYTDIDYQNDEVFLTDSKGNLIDEFTVEDLMEHYLDCSRTMNYVQDDDYIADKKDILET